MMYLSSLLINTGDNPDRPNWDVSRRWLRNVYHVHQRLCMAFPSNQRTVADSEMVQPYCPADFGDGQIHVPRDTSSGFLFRIDPQPGGRVVVLVQSAMQPDWDYAFHNAGFLLAAPPQVKAFDPRFAPGQRFWFRLVANPTRRLSGHSRAGNGQPVAANWVGKRVPVPTDQLCDWFVSRAEPAGFSIDIESVTILTGFVYVNKQRTGSGQRLRSARYEGILTVANPTAMAAAIAAGIGPAKAFGFGLLSLATLPDV